MIFLVNIKKFCLTFNPPDSPETPHLFFYPYCQIVVHKHYFLLLDHHKSLLMLLWSQNYQAFLQLAFTICFLNGYLLKILLRILNPSNGTSNKKYQIYLHHQFHSIKLLHNNLHLLQLKEILVCHQWDRWLKILSLSWSH